MKNTVYHDLSATQRSVSLKIVSFLNFDKDAWKVANKKIGVDKYMLK